LKLYPPSQVEVFLGSQATEANAKSANRLGQYRFLHLAVHGLLNENRSQYSGVVLSLPREQIQTSHIEKPPASVAAAGKTPATNDEDTTLPEEDGLLQVFEIFNLKLNADLVVLSACETGLGKETKGEGLVGLTQAFLYAGSPALVVSVWKVQDRSTAELMVAFYRHLNNPTLNKAQALRQAQLDMIRQGTFSHPYYWAGFVLIGRP
jgi:CHAT domain-containing protein